MAYTENEIMDMLEKGTGGLYNEDIIKLINSKNTTISLLTEEKDKAWELFKKKTDENVELQTLCGKLRAEIESIKTEAIKKFLSEAKKHSEIVYGDRAVCVELLDETCKKMIGDNK